MPELPEVETVRRGLEPALDGATLSRVDLRRPDLRFALPDRLADQITGRTVLSLGRRAKYLLIHLSGGLTLISHLGMSGSWRVEAEGGAETIPGATYHPRGKIGIHDHVVVSIMRGGVPAGRVIYNDPRRFGFLLLCDTADLDGHPALAGLGVEPTGNRLDGERLSAILAGRNVPLKAALLDQRLIAGLGNIYVCEALWRSRLSPRRKAASLVSRRGGPSLRAERLALAIRAVISEAIEAGGSSLRDHIRADGTLGYFQHSFSVYDREGQECARPDCAGVIRRIVQSGRSTFYCPDCQR